MNFAHSPEEGPWDATRGSHQWATDPRRQVGGGKCSCQDALSKCSPARPRPLHAGWETLGPQRERQLRKWPLQILLIKLWVAPRLVTHRHPHPLADRLELSEH